MSLFSSRLNSKGSAVQAPGEWVLGLCSDTLVTFSNAGGWQIRECAEKISAHNSAATAIPDVVICWPHLIRRGHCTQIATATITESNRFTQRAQFRIVERKQSVLLLWPSCLKNLC